jgi:predicted aspartyl protease
MTITGEVTPFLEAAVKIVVLGAGGRQLETVAVIDTGFSDYLTLGQVQIELLSLAFEAWTDIQLADGQEARLAMYSAYVEWLGRSREISVIASGSECL